MEALGNTQLKSINFEILRERLPELANLGAAAEAYAYSDPQSAVVKLRCFGELLVGHVIRELQLPIDATANFHDRLENVSFKSSIDRPILSKLHAIRMKGNDAAHSKKISVGDANWLVKEAYLLSCWFCLSTGYLNENQLPPFNPPVDTSAENSETEAELQDTNDVLKELLMEKTIQLEEAMKELESVRLSELKIQKELAKVEIQRNKEKVEKFTRLSAKVGQKIDLQDYVTNRNIRMNDVFNEYELTKGQQELVAELENFLSNRNENVFLLKGYAGTGKTFITKGLTEYFRMIGRNYILAAPTGKASKVIASKTNSAAYTLHKTIYSFNDIREFKEDNLDGSETYKFYAALAVNELSVDTVYIVDEASMISNVYNENEFFKCGTGYLLNDFLKFVNLDHNDHRKKVIFIGDNAQLPPVGMSFSPALDSDYLKKEHSLSTTDYELTEVVRQKAESGVMHNAMALRKSLQQNIFNQLDIDLSYSDVSHVDHSDLIKQYLNSCDRKINAESIIIAHSNSDVADYNRRIREEFFPGKLKVCAGDKIMAVNNSDAHGFFISNGDFGLVRQVNGMTETRTLTLKRRVQKTDEVEETKVILKFRDLVVSFRDLNGVVQTFSSKLIENLLYSDAPALSSDENKALYLDFCIRNKYLKKGSLEFKETLRSDPYFNALRVKFGYAITCHKAQGSEWNNVFVKCQTHQSQLSASYFRWLYTAITRTSKNLYLLDEPHLKIGGGIKPVSNPGAIEEPSKAIDSVSEPTEIPSEADNNDKQTYGIPATNGFLLSLLNQVESLIEGSDAKIHDIQHHRFNEGYIFSLGAETARINFSYNKKQIISAVVLATESELGKKLLEKLSQLKGKVISSLLNINRDLEIDFEHDFLKEYYLQLKLLAEKLGITIINVEQLQYRQRYHFNRNDDLAVIDVSYNKAKRITSYEPFRKQCTSPSFVNECISIIEAL